MALQIISADVFATSANALMITTISDYVVLAGVTLSSTGAAGILTNSTVMTGSVRVQGAVLGGTVGIQIDGINAAYFDYRLEIGAQGYVMGGNYGVYVASSGNRITNLGQISGATGIGFGGTSSPNTLTNHGTISGENYGVLGNVISGGAAGVRLQNFGLISATTAFYGNDGNAADVLTNRGRMVGAVAMGAGDDTMDNRGGEILGDINLGVGADSFLPGAGVETVDGGDGSNDRLVLRSGGAVVVDLMDSSLNTGALLGDGIIGFEYIEGSNTGGDRLAGDDGGNALMGYGGADTLIGRGGTDSLMGGAGNDRLDGGAGLDGMMGGAGDDTFIVETLGDFASENPGEGHDLVLSAIDFVLGVNVEDGRVTSATGRALTGNDGINGLTGGAGNDRLSGLGGKDVLTGGKGNDAFVFLGPTQAGDVIKDFANAAGNNDRLLIEGSAFGFGSATGAVAAGRFVIRADSAAQDADDRFIFRSTDQTLWFDADGKGGLGAVLLADLQAGASLTASDLLLI